ncbi:HIT family hydrolase [Candidatus Berkelbacteria bacterium RIFOXYA2_FULL_43_10]|uniref:HIT family hydrolase n=1 Tax=Candidatus Berkelbacteria bacterium RIFOXYA2_FULL_43_10 TaxID=1797472 RepID=A0A1F5EDL6_9BACT|nr:MAG: HIT family hydrolase [Candidatus Berkelbacteria bacterium RIFOXYA2_FULL_43_10]
MEECIFCKIVKGEVPSSKIYEDDLVIAFMDIKPVNPGHALVVSKEHQKYISDLDDKSTARLISVAGKINKALRKSEIRCEDVNYFLADGEVAGQEVAHAHLHIIPRFKNDGFGLKFPAEYGKMLSGEELNKSASNIIKYLDE